MCDTLFCYPSIYRRLVLKGVNIPACGKVGGQGGAVDPLAMGAVQIGHGGDFGKPVLES